MSQQPPPSGPRSDAQGQSTAAANSTETSQNSTTVDETKIEGVRAADNTPVPSATTATSEGEVSTIESQGAAPYVTSAPGPAVPVTQPDPATAAAPPTQAIPVVTAPTAAPAPNGASAVAASAPSTAGRPANIPADDIVYTPFALSIGDGFKFGCGMVLAMFVTVMVVVLLAAIGFLVASMAGLSVPLGSIAR